MDTKTGSGSFAVVLSARPFVRWDRGCNTLFLRPSTGAWVVVTGIGAEIIERCNGLCSSGDVAAEIARRYAIAPSVARSDVNNFLQKLLAVGFFREPPSESSARFEALALHVTAKCSLNCRHCYASPAPGGTDPPLDLLISAVRQARDLGATTFKFTGGEPFQRPEALATLAEHVVGCEVTVLTNGLAPIAELRDIVRRRGWRLQISLDGAQPQTHDWYRGADTYVRLAQNMEALAREGLTGSVTLSVCVSRVNRSELTAIVERGVAWGVREVHITRISKHGRAIEYWDELSMTPEQWVQTYRELVDLRNQYRDQVRLTGVLADYVESCLVHHELRGCHLGRQLMADLDGYVYPCIMVGTAPMRLGRLQHDTLASCLERVQSVAVQCATRLSDETVCGTCDWRMVCRGACPGWLLVQDGDLMRTDELCQLRRDLFVNEAFKLAEHGSQLAGPSSSAATS